MLFPRLSPGHSQAGRHYSNGEIEKMFVEDGLADDCPTDPFEVSDADTMLAYLKSR